MCGEGGGGCGVDGADGSGGELQYDWGGEWCTGSGDVDIDVDGGGFDDSNIGGGGEQMTGHVAQSLMHSNPVSGSPI